MSAMQVRLLGATDGQTTGLSRYALSLQAELRAEGVRVETVGPKLPPLPGPMYDLFRRAGFNLRHFFTTYPLAIPTAPPGVITHITAQNQATALALGSVPPRTIISVHDIITLAYRNDPR